MTNLPRVGIVGLGNIAQKAYLPVLSKQTNWNLVGAFSPNKQKRGAICQQYRIDSFSSLSSLSSACDAVFVHSSTDSHSEVVSCLLSAGMDVYVDKPLAANVEEAEHLARLSEKTGRKLMVGFNRRFAPMYVKAKEVADKFDLVHMEKHRVDSVGPHSYAFTMLDDYLHLVDTLRWLGSGQIDVTSSFAKTNKQEQLLFAKHMYQNGDTVFSSAMHRRAGSNLEKLEFVREHSIVRVLNMNRLEMEKDNKINTSAPASWETILKTRGFEDCIHHFISCVQNDDTPAVDGWEALKSQLLLKTVLERDEMN